MNKLAVSSSFLFVLACGVASLLSGCATTEPAPAPAPSPAPSPTPMAHKVGGACSYAVHPGQFTVTKVDGANVHFAFHLPAGEPLTWAGQPDAAMNQNVARFEGNLVGQVTSDIPSVGQSFPGFRQEESHGTCTPWAYQVSIGGGTLSLQPAS